MMIQKQIKVSIIFIWLFLLICNILLTLVSDDYGYILDSRRGFQAIIDSYMHHNARFGNLLAFTYIAWIPRIVFDFINSVIGVLFILQLFVLIKGELPTERRDNFTLWLILGLIISFNAYGSIFLWEIGAANYLHGLLLLSYCLTPFRFFWGTKLFGEQHDSYHIWMIIFCLFAGWSSEQVGIITILIFLTLFIVAIIKKIKLPRWYWLGVALFTIGYCLLYFAPGEGVRGNESNSYIDVATFLKSDFSLQIDRITHGFQQYHSKQYMFYLLFMIVWLTTTSTMKNRWIKYSFIALIFAISVIIEKFGWCIIDTFILFAILVHKTSKHWNKKHNNLYLLLLSALFFYILCCCCAALVPFPMRAKFGGDLLLIVSIIIITRHWFSSLPEKRQKKYSQILYLYLGLVCSFIITAYTLYRIHWEDSLEKAKISVNSGNYDIVMNKETFESFYPFLGDWVNPGQDYTQWPNDTYCLYFGWNSLTVK